LRKISDTSDCETLRASGYTGTLSIEHEDLAFSPVEGVRRSVELLRAALEAQPAA